VLNWVSQKGKKEKSLVLSAVDGRNTSGNQYMEDIIL
jgi:hypothetical protein